jgi:urease accessory protein
MLTINERLLEPLPATARLVLPFELRQRSRQRCRLSSGEEVAVVLERGTVLRGGDRLRAEDGRVVEVVAAPETVSVVRASDPWRLARAAYHLGNRHIPVQVGNGWLRYLHDHVLDDMVHGLGFALDIQVQPFEPEGGAYAHSGHDNAHASGNGHDHAPAYGNGHGHGQRHAP